MFSVDKRISSFGPVRITSPASCAVATRVSAAFKSFFFLNVLPSYSS